MDGERLRWSRRPQRRVECVGHATRGSSRRRRRRACPTPPVVQARIGSRVAPSDPRAIRRRTGRYGAPMLSQRKRLLILAVPVAVSLVLAGPASAADSKGAKAILKGG